MQRDRAMKKGTDRMNWPLATTAHLSAALSRSCFSPYSLCSPWFRLSASGEAALV
jgi:hypothetical protein